MKSTRRTLLKGAGAGGVALASVRFSPLSFSQDVAVPSGVVDHVPTTCWIGKQDCGMLARRIDGRVVKFEGDPRNPRNVGTLCPKGNAQIVGLYDPTRVKTPLERTNEKGISGKWRQISWDEALDKVADRMKKIRKKDPELLLWQKGRSKAKVFYDEAFVGATEAQKMGHGGYCSDAGYRALEYTIGLHGVIHPDFRHTEYVLSWGWNITGAGGNKFCWLTWPQELVEAKKRGVKLVHIDPRLRPAGGFADEWVPIRPATDMALALALCNRLIKQGDIDKPYLRKFTNAPYLVKKDGTFLRVGGKEQIWDTASGGAKAAGGGKPALEGEYTVDGQKVKPAFQVFKEHVAKKTPQWAAGVCGIDATQIAQIAKDLGENAHIGETTKIDGKEIPYRPVSCMAYHMAQQENGMQALRAMTMVFMLMGAWGAVGGPKSDFTWKIHDHYEEYEDIEIEDPPYGVQLKHSKFYPINTGLPSVAALSTLDPKKFEVDPKKIPEMMILHMANPIISFPNNGVMQKAYKKIDYVAAISPWLSETADYFADVILPAATLEKYEGPTSAGTQYVDAKTLRLPPMDPLFESRGEIDIYLDLCERAGVLFGKGGYLDIVNQELELSGEEAKAGGKFALPLNKKPGVRHIFDNWAKANELKGGIKFFEKEGVQNKGPLPPEEVYGYVTDPPFGGALHRFYGESLLKARNTMKSKGAGKAYYQDYTALPTWRKPTMDGSPGDFDLYLISYKLIEFKQSRASFFPLLAELAPKQVLAINPKTAKAKGIGDGDEVTVESHNAVTGETQSLKVNVEYMESMRPDTVGMPHHYGMWTHAWNKGQGPTPNEIIPTGEGYVTNTADQSFHVKVKVTKA